MTLWHYAPKFGASFFYVIILRTPNSSEGLANESEWRTLYKGVSPESLSVAFSVSDWPG